jgi:hypothetical protein
MSRSPRLRGLAVLAPLAVSGCLANLAPDPDLGYLRIAWVDSYEVARREAAECRRPILLVMVAGDKLDRC